MSGSGAAAAPGQTAPSGLPAHPRAGRPFARPGRRAVVADDLAELRGPASGRVELPLRLFWSLPDHQFDLDDHDMLLWYYQTVLREASRAADLTGYLDGATLLRLWPELYLPKAVRGAWEERHPVLRTAAAAA
jgi:hypothetical protein